MKRSTPAAESAAVFEAADVMQYLMVLYRQMTEAVATKARLAISSVWVHVPMGVGRRWQV
eukprot:1968522-Amphidinium_carterae.1